MRSDYVYKDRKMMKWMPFNALLEQGDHISDMLHGRERKTMPVLSDDQQAELNYNLETAYIFRSEIEVTYFDNHQFHTTIGIITRTDLHNKLIFINDIPIHAQQITQIEAT